MNLRRFMQRRRPKRLHPDNPWPVEDIWAHDKLIELSDPHNTCTTVWVDETCGLCVIEHNMGGEMGRRRNPSCDRHRLGGS